MLEIASQMILCLLLAALLGSIIGYLFGKMSCASDECGHTEEDPSHGDSHHAHDSNTHVETNTSPTALISTTTGAHYPAPKTLNKARNGIKDDLTQIKGLNPGLEASLNNHGIYHYDQIASWSDENTAWADNTLNLKGKAKNEDWAGQAKSMISEKKTTLSTATSTTKTATSPKTPTSATSPVAATSAAASAKETTPTHKQTPQVLSTPHNGDKDNLSKIKGKAKNEDGGRQAKSISSDKKGALSTDTTKTPTSTTSPVAGTSSAAASAKETTPTHKQTPQVLSAPRNGDKDNLSKIKGVGMKIEDALNEIGIYHFDQIAAWTEKNIEWADNSLGFPGRANREKWVEQAKLLASGEETDFSKRVDAGEVKSSK
jgi:predicted flap endonuclease-1-like 5' DNA nuclease